MPSKTIRSFAFSSSIKEDVLDALQSKHQKTGESKVDILDRALRKELGMKARPREKRRGDEGEADFFAIAIIVTICLVVVIVLLPDPRPLPKSSVEIARQAEEEKMYEKAQAISDWRTNIQECVAATKSMEDCKTIWGEKP